MLIHQKKTLLTTFNQRKAGVKIFQLDKERR